MRAISGSGVGGLYRYSHDVLSVEPTAQLGLSFTSLLEDHDGGLWFGTSKGLYRMENGRIVPATSVDDLCTIRSRPFLKTGTRIYGSEQATPGCTDCRAAYGHRLPMSTACPMTRFSRSPRIGRANGGEIYIFNQGGGLTRLKDGESAQTLLAAKTRQHLDDASLAAANIRLLSIDNGAVRAHFYNMCAGRHVQNLRLVIEFRNLATLRTI